MDRSMIIYPQEYSDGIADVIFSKASTTYEVPVLNKTFSQSIDVDEQLIKAAHAKRDFDTIDLFPLYSVLVSIAWNKNDDIFTKEEAWAARHSPENKPFNFMHDQKNIIGHIKNSFPVNASFDRLDDNLDLSKIPSKFHLITSAVIYRCWEDPSKQREMDRILAEIVEGNKWFVSMECLFRGFDYGILRTDGESRVIARSAETAGLTKYLRAYGGPGTYNGYKIGRVLRQITFSGKGLVNNPANPESVILDNFNSTQTSLGYVNNMTNINGETLMTNDVVELLKSQIAELTAQLETQKSEASISRVHVLEAQIEALKKGKDEHDREMQKHLSEKESLMSEHANHIEQMSKAAEDKEKEAKDKVDKMEKDCAALKAQVDELTKANEYMQKELDEYKKASKKNARKADAAKLYSDDETGKAELDKFIENTLVLADEAFTAVINSIATRPIRPGPSVPMTPGSVLQPEHATPSQPKNVPPTPGQPSGIESGDMEIDGGGGGGKKAQLPCEGDPDENPKASAKTANDVIDSAKSGNSAPLGVSVDVNKSRVAGDILEWFKSNRSQRKGEK